MPTNPRRHIERHIAAKQLFDRQSVPNDALQQSIDRNNTTHSALQASDLFFNYDHPAYDKLHSEKSRDKRDNAPFTDNEVFAAITMDAVEFCATLEVAFGIIIDPAALAADFIRRV